MLKSKVGDLRPRHVAAHKAGGEASWPSIQSESTMRDIVTCPLAGLTSMETKVKAA